MTVSDAVVYIAEGDVAVPVARLARGSNESGTNITQLRVAVRAVADILTRKAVPLPSAFGRRYSRFEGSDPAVHPATGKEAAAFMEAAQPMAEFDIRVTTPALVGLLTSEQYQQLMRVIDDIVLSVTIVPSEPHEAVGPQVTTTAVDSDDDDDDDVDDEVGGGFAPRTDTVKGGGGRVGVGSAGSAASTAKTTNKPPKASASAAAAAASSSARRSVHDMALALTAERANVTVDFGTGGAPTTASSVLDIRCDNLAVRTVTGQYGGQKPLS